MRVREGCVTHTCAPVVMQLGRHFWGLSFRSKWIQQEVGGMLTEMGRTRSAPTTIPVFAQFAEPALPHRLSRGSRRRSAVLASSSFHVHHLLQVLPPCPNRNPISKPAQIAAHDRRRSRGLPGWLKGLIAAAIALALGFFAWQQLADRFLVPTVETTSRSLVTPDAGAAAARRHGLCGSAAQSERRAAHSLAAASRKF